MAQQEDPTKKVNVEQAVKTPVPFSSQSNQQPVVNSVPVVNKTVPKNLNATSQQVDAYIHHKEKAKTIPGYTPSVAANADEITHDYAGIVMAGVSDENIAEKAYTDPTVKVGLSSFDEFVNNEKYQEAYMQSGKTKEDWIKEAPEFYSQVSQKYANYQKGQFEEVPFESVYKRRVDSKYADALGGAKFHQKFDRPKQIKDTRFELNYATGKMVRTKTDEEFADERGTYVPAYKNKEGEKTGMLNWYLENKYKLTSSNENVLKLEYDQEGLPYWHEVDMRNDLKSNEIRSVSGPQQMYSNGWTEFFQGVVRNTAASTPQYLADFSTMGGLWENMAYSEEKNNYNLWEYQRNLSAFMKYKPSYEAQTNDPFSNMSAFGSTMGSVFGSLAEMIATKKPSTALFGKFTVSSAGKAAGYSTSLGLTNKGKQLMRQGTLTPMSFIAASPNSSSVRVPIIDSETIVAAAKGINK